MTRENDIAQAHATILKAAAAQAANAGDPNRALELQVAATAAGAEAANAEAPEALEKLPVVNLRHSKGSTIPSGIIAALIERGEKLAKGEKPTTPPGPSNGRF